MLDRLTAESVWVRSLPRKKRESYDWHKLDWDQISSGLIAKADHLAAQPHIWAPIRLGIVMVLVGFVLQAVGAVPC
jgi:hypothetical protein